MFNCGVGRVEHCKQISLACVGSACSVLPTLGLLLLTVCVLSWFTLFRVLVALLGNCLRWTLGCVHFSDLCHSGSDSRVLHKSIDSVGHAFCAIPGSEQCRRQVLGERTVPGGLCILITSLVPAAWFPVCASRAQSQVCCVSPLGS